MSLKSLKKKLHILRSLSRLRRIKGVMKRKQVEQFWITDILKSREEFGVFNKLFGELNMGCEYFVR